MAKNNKIIRLWNRKGDDAVDVLYIDNEDGTYSQSVIDTSGAVYEPIGAHSSGATISNATTLTKPTGATKIIMQALTQNVRFTLDGTTPTSTVGFQLLAGSSPFIIQVPGESIKVIQEIATASLQYQWVS